jgi:hypothetical protein
MAGRNAESVAFDTNATNLFPGASSGGNAARWVSNYGLDRLALDQSGNQLPHDSRNATMSNLGTVAAWWCAGLDCGSDVTGLHDDRYKNLMFTNPGLSSSYPTDSGVPFDFASTCCVPSIVIDPVSYNLYVAYTTFDGRVDQAVWLFPGLDPPQPNFIRPVSVSTIGGQEPNARCYVGGQSVDGNTLVFDTAATNLSPWDLDSLEDVYVWHYNDGGSYLTLASVSTAGVKGNGDSAIASISYDGRYVVFQSSATNLVPGDSNGVEDVFVRDLATQTTHRVSVGSNEQEGNSRSWKPSISGNGQVVFFDSFATNFVQGVGHGIYAREWRKGTTRLVTVDQDGRPIASVQVNGFVAVGALGDFVFFDTGMPLIEGEVLDGYSHVYRAIGVLDPAIFVEDFEWGDTRGWSFSTLF